MNRKQRKQRARDRKIAGANQSPQKLHGDKLEPQIPRGIDARSDEAIRSSQRAQRSEVHETTDDASTSPTSGARPPKRHPDAADDRARLFPDSQGDRDESDFGGPARLETDEQGNLKD